MPVPRHISPVKRPSARQLVYDQLLEWIQDGQLEPGEILQDGQIAKLFGVSRTPVREAISHLVVQGLVEVEPGRVTRVTPLDVAVWRDIYEPIVALESIAAARAATRATPQDLDRLRQIQDKFARAVAQGDLKRSRSLDLEFHQAVVDASGNRFLSDPLATLRVHRERMGRAFFDGIGPRSESVDEHEDLLRAIALADPNAAGEAMSRNWRALATRMELAAPGVNRA